MHVITSKSLPRCRDDSIQHPLILVLYTLSLLSFLEIHRRRHAHIHRHDKILPFSPFFCFEDFNFLRFSIHIYSPNTITIVVLDQKCKNCVLLFLLLVSCGGTIAKRKKIKKCGTGVGEQNVDSKRLDWTA